MECEEKNIKKWVYVLIKIVCLFFQAKKIQYMRQNGQRLIEMDCILMRGAWI